MITVEYYTKVVEKFNNKEVLRFRNTGLQAEKSSSDKSKF